MTGKLTAAQRQAAIEQAGVCPHCAGAGPEPGLIEQDDNGPIVECLLCNGNGCRLCFLFGCYVGICFGAALAQLLIRWSGVIP